MAGTPNTCVLRRRGGFSQSGLIAVLVLVLAVPLAAWWLLSRLPWSDSNRAGPMMHVVQRGGFVHDVTERGNVESASNTEIRCEVKSLKTSSGATILEIVPEGTNITTEDVGKKVLVRLDSSSLEEDRTKQQILCETSKATVIQAQNVLDTAKIAQREYLKGTYLAELLDLDIKVSEAEVALRQAREYLAFSERLERKGYTTKLQLENDKTAVEEAGNKLKLFLKQREVLRQFNKEKMEKQLDAEIKTAEARLAAEKASHDLDMERLRFIEEQIENCTIVASEPGQVVYANVTSHRGSGEVVIEEGTVVRENQVIFRLPDPSRMQVSAKINEARISLVEAGMDATIRLDAFPDLELAGMVEELGEYPAPTSWYNSDVKEYEAIVKIHEPPPGIRPGLTAEVKIRVVHVDDVLQLPVQAVIEHGNEHFCVFPAGDGFRASEITIGASNDKFVVIKKGLEAGDKVVHNAEKYRDELDLPDLPPETQRPDLPSGTERPDGQRAGPQRTDGQGTESGPPGGRPDPGRMFGRLDANGNGRLEKEELGSLPAPMRSGLAAADANGDGVIDRGEFRAAAARFSPARHGEPRGGGRP